MPFKETKEVQTHYCEACEANSKQMKNVTQHTCGMFGMTNEKDQEFKSVDEKLKTLLEKCYD